MKRFWWAVVLIVLVTIVVAVWPWLRPGNEVSQPAPVGVAAPEPVAITAPPPPVAPPPRESVTRAMTETGIAVRIVRRVVLARPVPPYGPAYQALMTLAQTGDRPAQYQLGLLLYECRDVPEADADLQKQIESLHQTRRRGGWDVSDPQAEAAQLTQRHGDCAGVPAVARGEYRDWIKSAADGGLVEAQLDMMYHLPQREFCQYLYQCTPDQRRAQEALQAESLHYVTMARDAGSAAALWTLGAWYQSDEVLPRDDVQAYAHYRALDQINAASGIDRRFEPMLKSIGQRLRPIDREEAETQARQLLQNPNCCVLTP